MAGAAARFFYWFVAGDDWVEAVAMLRAPTVVVTGVNLWRRGASWRY